MNPVQEFQREVAANISSLKSARDMQDLSRIWLRDSLAFHYSYNFTWLGRPIIQYPQDIVAIQELVWRIKPEVIIETGVAHGGSLVLTASLLALLDYSDAVSNATILDPRASNRQVIGIDIDIREHNRAAIQAHPLSSKIKLVQGSSTSAEVVAKVRQLMDGASQVLVILDSNHTRAHVLAELEVYAPLVSKGSYCVVMDTAIEHLPVTAYPDRPWSRGNSPMTAVHDYLGQLEERNVLAADGERLRMVADSSIDSKLLITVAPSGYLHRVESSNSEMV